MKLTEDHIRSFIQIFMKLQVDGEVECEVIFNTTRHARMLRHIVNDARIVLGIMIGRNDKKNTWVWKLPCPVPDFGLWAESRIAHYLIETRTEESNAATAIHIHPRVKELMPRKRASYAELEQRVATLEAQVTRLHNTVTQLIQAQEKPQ